MEFIYYHCGSHFPTDETNYDACFHESHDVNNVIENNYEIFIETCGCFSKKSLLSKLNINECNINVVISYFCKTENTNYTVFNIENIKYITKYGKFYIEESIFKSLEDYEQYMIYIYTGTKYCNITANEFLSKIMEGSIVTAEDEDSLKYVNYLLSNSNFDLKRLQKEIRDVYMVSLYLIVKKYTNTKPAVKK